LRLPILVRLLHRTTLREHHKFEIRNTKSETNPNGKGRKSKMMQAVKRNRDRFPEDFCIELSAEEYKNLRYYFGTSSWGGR
jgi:hypothetical protein